MPIITDDDIGHIIFGSPGADTINALGGNDTIIPQTGVDVVHGDAGLLDVLAVDYSASLTPVTMTVPTFSGADYSGFDAPGGEGVVVIGSAGSGTGAQTTFSGFAAGQFNALWVGINGPQLATDGAIDEAGENLTFSGGFGTNVAVWTGSSDIVSGTYTGVVLTRLTVTINSGGANWIDPTTIGLSGGPAAITYINAPSITYTSLFEVSSDGGTTWAAVNDFRTANSTAELPQFTAVRNFAYDDGGYSGTVSDGTNSVTYDHIESLSVTGGSADDTLHGAANHDDLRGGGGDDIIIARGGNDTIMGGAGLLGDLAIFSGNRADYVITAQAGDAITVSDMRPGSPDGVDGLSGIEFLTFADGTVAANAQPAVDLNGAGAGTGFSGSFNEGGPATAIGSGIDIIDPDSGDPIERATITISNPNPGDLLSLAGMLPAGISVDGSSTSTSLVLTGVATQSNYEAALALMRFSSSSDDPTAGGNTSRTIFVTVRDGSFDSLAGTATIAVTGVNDAPDISEQAGDSAASTQSEANATVAATGTLTVRDPDSADTVSHQVIAFLASGTLTGLQTSIPTIATTMLTLSPPVLNADPADINNLTWTFNSGAEHFDYLAVTESLVLAYQIQVGDSGSPQLFDQHDITITINGTNDAPLILLTPGDSFAISLSETNAALAGSATLTVIDPDHSDQLTAALSGFSMSGTTTGLGSTPAQLQAMLTFPAGPFAADPLEVNNFTYSFNSAPEAFDYLDDGESLTLTYAIDVDDGHSATDSQAVQVVIAGSNDAPVISVGGGDVASVIGLETDAPLVGSFFLTVVDPDVSDSVTASVAGVVVSGVTLGLVPTNAQLLAMMSVTSGSIAADPGSASNLAWTFNSTPEAFNYLDEGETLMLTYTVRVTDDSGATDDQDVVIAITGTNDAPTIGLVSPNDSDSASLTDGSGPLFVQGKLTAVDPDYSDSLTASVPVVFSMPAFPGAFPFFTVAPTSLAADPAGTGPVSPANLTWQFLVDGSQFDYLAAGETQLLRYTVRVVDDSSAFADRDVSITITGINEAPIVAGSLPPATAVVELPDGSAGEGGTALAGTGVIAFTDTDLSDTHSASVTANGGGYLGIFSLSSVNQGANSVGWEFSILDATLNSLGQGVVLHQSYTVTIDDGHGGTSSIVVGVDLIGSNDAAILSSANVVVTQALVPVSAGGILTITDEDNPALFQGLSDVQGTYGKLDLAADGSWSYLADGPLLGLAPGDVATDIFTVFAVDGTPTTISVSIAGSPDIAIAQMDNFSTDEATVIGSGLSLFSDNGSGADADPDGPPLTIAAVNGDPAFVGQQILLASGALLTVNADGTFSYDPNHAFDSLTLAAGAMNQSDYDSFTYRLAGGTSTTVFVNIAGVNGAGDLLRGDGGNNVVTGFDGVGDMFRFEAGGSDSGTGLGGNDGFYFGAAFDGSDDVDGGAGADTLALQGNTSASLGDVSDVEVLLALSGSDTRFGDLSGNSYDYDLATNDSNVGAGEILTVSATGLLPGEDLHFDGSAETDGHFRIFAGQGDDELTGGAGNDGFFFGADGNLTGADQVDGGAGTDTLALRGNYSGAAAVVMNAMTMTGVEVMAFLTGHANPLGGPIAPAGFDYDVTTADGNVASGQRLDVIATGLAADENVRFDGRAETDGSFRILSGAGDDTLWGGAGNDLLYGGRGADRLIGGGGADTYAYLSAAESTSTGFDTIVGFDWHVDRIDAPGGATRALSSAGTGTLSLASFDANLASGLAGLLGAGQAALFAANAGDMSGRIFAVIDANGIAGYQAGQDLVIELVSPVLPIDPMAGVIV